MNKKHGLKVNPTINELYKKILKKCLKKLNDVFIFPREKHSTKNTKIGLTMRQNGLGRFEWIEEAKEKSKKGKK